MQGCYYLELVKSERVCFGPPVKIIWLWSSRPFKLKFFTFSRNFIIFSLILRCSRAPQDFSLPHLKAFRMLLAEGASSSWFKNVKLLLPPDESLLLESLLLKELGFVYCLPVAKLFSHFAPCTLYSKNLNDYKLFDPKRNKFYWLSF